MLIITKSKMISMVLVLSMLSACSEAQEIRIVVSGEQQPGSQLELYSVSNNDTVQLEALNDQTFKVDDDFYSKPVLIRFGSFAFQLNKVEKHARSIVLELNASANNCYAIHRIYGDVMQSDLDRVKGCDSFHEIRIYDKTKPETESPAIKLRKKDNG